MDEVRGFGLYVHWPFCQSKCPYCDFNSHVASAVNQREWRDALVSEIERSAEEPGIRVLDSIFFGGGTPSLMDPETVNAIVEAARSAWAPSNTMEVTLEANPSSVESARFRDYSGAGINRVSIGVQSLVEEDLRRLGRLHSVAEARNAVEIAQETFDRISIDLIYAREDQTVCAWRSELAEAIRMEPSHLSLYQLTIEEGTAFGALHRNGKLKGLPDEDLGAQLFDVTQELTQSAGYHAYEVSNHAQPGQESQHNLIYWKSAEWVGVGPGAHGRIDLSGDRVATETVLNPGQWLDAVRISGSGERGRETLSKRERLEELVLMGLRLSEGVCEELLDGLKLSKINELREWGLVASQDGRLRATRAGRKLLNYVVRELLS